MRLARTGPMPLISPDDALGELSIEFGGEFGAGVGEFVGGEVTEDGSGHGAVESSVVGVTVEVGLFEVVEGDFVDEPVGRLPGVVAPDEGMSVESDALGAAEFDDGVGGGSAPVGLALGVGAVVPEVGGVAVFGGEAWVSLLEFELLPVEGDGCGVEE